MAADPYKYFRAEASEIAGQLGQGILELERDPGSADAIRRLLRLAHTLKGAALVVKQREIADAAHDIESALAPYREAAAPQVAKSAADAILRRIDEISERVAGLFPPADPEAPSRVRPAPEEPFRAMRIDVADMDSLLEGMAEAHTQLAAIRQSVRSIERARQIANFLAEEAFSPRAKQAAQPGDRVALLKTRSLAEELRNIVAGLERDVTAGVEQIDVELRQVRAAAERLRLIPASAVFGLLERAARDAAQAVGKRVAFEGKGGEIRLDAHVLGVLQNALVQVVRNGVAHGIERETERLAAGKNPEGRITVEVARRGKRVAFVCTDDGRGLDGEAIRRAAQRKGLLSAQTQKLSPGDLLQLLLDGGLSTSANVTEVSGRGIGLDIVREAADSLGGNVTVETEAGKGTVVEVIVPASLFSLQALMVEAGGVSAAIPLDAIVETLWIPSGEVARTPEGLSISFQGKAIPFMTLERPLTRGGRVSRADKAFLTVVLRAGTALAGIGVDKLVGTANVVLHPLPELTPVEPIVAGAFLDPQGNPQVVLDAEGLVARAGQEKYIGAVEQLARRPVLVIDDSLTTRMLEQSILEAAGYEVDIATSGEEGLEKARLRPYGLFLVDVEMPGIDGFTFVERARTDPALRTIPSVLVTSRNSPADRKRGEDAGAAGYIIKSEFDQANFLEGIRRLVS